jgi:hypothetical protein
MYGEGVMEDMVVKINKRFRLCERKVTFFLTILMAILMATFVVGLHRRFVLIIKSHRKSREDEI